MIRDKFIIHCFKVTAILFFMIEQAFASNDMGTVSGNTLLFLSHSMPPPLIKAYVSQAKHYHIPIMLRGLVNHSIQATQQFITDYDVKAVWLIDPTAYQKYHIQTVPCLVRIDESTQIAKKLCGSVSIPYALETLSSNNDSKIKEGIS